MVHGWTAERRTRQAELIHTWRPWERATGPKTASGKRRSSRNAYRPESAARAMRSLKKEVVALILHAKETSPISKR